MHLKSITLLVALTASCISAAWPYGQQAIKGVNVGSWLVLEKWITPQVFAGLPSTVIDEYTLCQYLGYNAAQLRLKAHWDAFVTEADFAFWAKTGLNHVRLPVGYWALDIKAGEPWVSGSWDYVVKAVGWAQKYGLQLMICLHGAPGSQNGQDHSGRSGSIGFYTNDNINRTVAIIGQIAQWASLPTQKDTVTVIELLNEPVLWGTDYQLRLNLLKTYYGLAYHQVRKYNNLTVVAIHDAFIDSSNWYYFNTLPEFYRVMLDTHLYQVFGDQFGLMSCAQHLQYPCTLQAKLIASNNKIWTIVGEFSLATPAQLNCVNQGIFARQQIGSYEKGSGWFMWAHENSQNWTEWSYKLAYGKKWINPLANNTAQC